MSTPWSSATGPARLAEVHARLRARKTETQTDQAHVFTQVFDTGTGSGSGCGCGSDTDNKQQADGSNTALSGALISIKDLFDVKGYVTRAGTQFMRDDKAAIADAPVIKRLRDAGALFTGHTNMTELAYSGLGLNPHYGTPANALLPKCIPGGSTAGGAVSVAMGDSDIAIGTDTGGSLRIPAAFNGIVGFKPSQASITRDGCKVLSHTLDSIGPMARSVTACKQAFDVMRNSTSGQQATANPTFVIPDNFGMDDLDDNVAQGFDLAVQALSRTGFKIETRAVPVLDALKSLAIWHFAAVEGRSAYDEQYTASHALFDPRVANRLARADEVDAVSYRKTLNTRITLVRRYTEEMRDAVLLMPTVPILPPKFSDISDDDAYLRLNLQVLRNPTIANVMDGCSISLPFKHNELPLGIMLSAPTHHDDCLLSVALDCERALLG